MAHLTDIRDLLTILRIISARFQLEHQWLSVNRAGTKLSSWREAKWGGGDGGIAGVSTILSPFLILHLDLNPIYSVEEIWEATVSAEIFPIPTLTPEMFSKGNQR